MALRLPTTILDRYPFLNGAPYYSGLCAYVLLHFSDQVQFVVRYSDHEAPRLLVRYEGHEEAANSEVGSLLWGDGFGLDPRPIESVCWAVGQTVYRLKALGKFPDRIIERREVPWDDDEALIRSTILSSFAPEKGATLALHDAYRVLTVILEGVDANDDEGNPTASILGRRWSGRAGIASLIRSLHGLGPVMRRPGDRARVFVGLRLREGVNFIIDEGPDAPDGGPDGGGPDAPDAPPETLPPQPSQPELTPDELADVDAMEAIAAQELGEPPPDPNRALDAIVDRKAHLASDVEGRARCGATANIVGLDAFRVAVSLGVGCGNCSRWLEAHPQPPPDAAGVAGEIPERNDVGIATSQPPPPTPENRPADAPDSPPTDSGRSPEAGKSTHKRAPKGAGEAVDRVVSLWPRAEGTKVSGMEISIRDALHLVRGGPVPRHLAHEEVADALRALPYTVAHLQTIEGERSQQRYKAETLPAIVPGGRFFGERTRERVAVNGARLSGVVVLDFDHLAEAGYDPAAIRDRAMGLKQRGLPHAVGAFVSPRKDGVKVLVHVSPVPKTFEEHEAAWRACARVFDDYLGVAADVSGSDVTRICYLSHDPNAIIAAPTWALRWREVPC